MNVRIESAEGYPDEAFVAEICGLDEPSYPIDLFARQLRHQHRVFGCYAYADDELIGYKLGFEPRPQYFESFLGAVRPDRRRQGIAAQLMDVQHEWCSVQGYRFITTVTAASNNAMIILNLKAGFVITGTLLDRGDNQKVLLQKDLAVGGT
ncbi:MAG: GNAT family N-acetyltransferase [Gammaproteobacteria bacterium]|nr:GNAT family N-acetyltransferase [Gammaproteobacteria bacterium]